VYHCRPQIHIVYTQSHSKYIYIHVTDALPVRDIGWYALLAHAQVLLRLDHLVELETSLKWILRIAPVRLTR
jgi:hypothetical protein